MYELNHEPESQGDEVQTLENNSSKKPTDPTKGLSSQQRDRYYSISHRYKGDTRTAVESVTARGRNSWSEFLRKSEKVNSTDGDLLAYYLGVMNAFDIGEAYTRHMVIETICGLRATHKQLGFTDNIPQQALEEFFLCFLVEEKSVEDEDGEGKHKVYIPTFSIVAKR